nr:hypothetical protein Itr_chr12CG14830 [Ipomoea trifida]
METFRRYFRIACQSRNLGKTLKAVAILHLIAVFFQRREPTMRHHRSPERDVVCRWGALIERGYGIVSIGIETDFVS